MGVICVRWSPLRLLFPSLLMMIVVRWHFPGLVGRAASPRLSVAVQGEPGFPQRGSYGIIALLGKTRGTATWSTVMPRGLETECIVATVLRVFVTEPGRVGNIHKMVVSGVPMARDSHVVRTVFVPCGAPGIIVGLCGLPRPRMDGACVGGDRLHPGICCTAGTSTFV